MRKLFLLIFMLTLVIKPTSAVEITPPDVPKAGAQLMPEDTSSFSDALIELLEKAIMTIEPDFAEAIQISATVISVVIVFSLLQSFNGSTQKVTYIAGSLTIASILLNSTNSLIRLGTDTITELSNYGKLLFPVMTTAMASQGGITTSTVLYTGTVAFDLILTSLISKILVPSVYSFIALAVANSAISEDVLKRLRDFIKWFISWTLKTLLTIFTTYMSITGVVSGTTDAVALKTTKYTISSMVPVVGGILSDASEAVLVSAGLVKNAAGIYGILAVLAVFLVPFLKTGIQYVLLKFTAALCSLFGTKQLSVLVDDFSTAMGFLLAMTGSVCLLILISTICFLKGVV